MSDPPRIAVVGGLNMDIHLFDLRRFPPRDTLVADRYLAEPGGKGSNQARAAARLGAEVTLVGRVGDDEFGALCVEATAADGVDVTNVIATSDARTGFVVIELVEGQHRSLVFAPGANGALTWDDVERALGDLAAADVVVVQAEVPPDVLSRLMVWGAETATPVFLDPAPPERVTRPVIAAAEVVTPDIEEGAGLTGRRDLGHIGAPLAARELLAMGARRVLLKLDAEGVILGDESGLRRIPTLAVEAVDETGAGDVFMAALAVRRAQGADWVDAARYANTAAALSVAGAGLTLPSAAEVEAAVGKLGDELEVIG